MIWWEVDGGAITTPTGGATNSSSGSGSTQATSSSSRTVVLSSETILDINRTADNGQRTFASHSQQGAGGDASETNENSQQRTAGETEDGHGAGEGWAWSYHSQGSTSSTSSFKEVAVTHLNLATNGAASATMSWSRTFAFGQTFTTSSYSSRSWTYGPAGGPTSSSSSSTSVSGSMTSTQSSTTSGSSTSSSPAVGSLQSRTSTTATCIHHGSTTSTVTGTTSVWSTDASSSAVTTAVNTTLTVTTASEFTVTGTMTTTVTGTISAGRKRNTIILADCGSQLLVAFARAGVDNGAARDWFEARGTSVLLEPFLAASVTSGTTTASNDTSGTMSGSTTAAASSAGETVASGQTTNNVWHGSSVNAGGVIVDAAGVIYPVGVRTASYAFDYPTFGSSGPLTLRYTGPCALAITLNPGYGKDASYSTLHASDGEALSVTFRPGVDVVVDACMAYAPGIDVEGQFQPWYVHEVACRDAPLRACG